MHFKYFSFKRYTVFLLIVFGTFFWSVGNFLILKEMTSINQHNHNLLKKNVKNELKNTIKKTNINYHICILTSQRPGNTSYLQKNLQKLQLQNTKERFQFTQDISVIDVDNHSLKFDDLKQFENKIIFKVAEQRIIPNCIDDGKDVGDTTINGNLSIPCKVWQLNLDFVLGLQICVKYVTLLNKNWILWVEDDVFSCENSLMVIDEILNKQSNKSCSILRFSTGLTAFAMSVSCVSKIISEIIPNIDKLPHDNLLIGNQIFEYTYSHPISLFYHAGQISTIEYRNQQQYLLLYQQLRNNICGDAF